MSDRPRHRLLRRLWSSLAFLSVDRRGAAMTEYAIAAGVIGLVAAVGIVSGGEMVLLDYVNSRDLVLLPAH